MQLSCSTAIEGPFSSQTENLVKVESSRQEDGVGVSQSKSSHKTTELLCCLVFCHWLSWSGPEGAGVGWSNILVKIKKPENHRARPLLSPLLLAQLCPVHIERAAVICPGLQTLRERERRSLNQQANRYLLHQQHAGILQVWRCLAQHQYQH